MNRKPIQLPDHGLWEEVKRSIKPLRQASPKRPVAQRLCGLANLAVSPLQLGTARSLLVTKHRPKSQTPPPLAQMDRRTAQRLGRGQIDPEATLDLHGDGIETARIKLLHFLSGQRHRGARLVLVITGKGASPFTRHTLHGHAHFQTPEWQGRLRREVPSWLHEEMFRVHVMGFQPAHPKHGGGGAYYVRLRKPPKPL